MKFFFFFFIFVLKRVKSKTIKTNTIGAFYLPKSISTNYYKIEAETKINTAKNAIWFSTL